MQNLNIELLPNLSFKPKDRSVKKRLENLLNQCETFMGCTAYWTLKLDFFLQKELALAIMKTGSFFCADIQSPTKIDNIDEYVKFGAKEIYLHKFRQSPEEYTNNTSLLHSKILLFKLDNENAEIWLGSHNMTKQAIQGKNLEASIAVQCKISDKFYKDIESYLINVRDKFCFQFDSNHIEIYKKLQMREAWKELNGFSLENTIALFGKDMETLENEVILQLLSLVQVDYSKFKIIGSFIYLYAYDVDTKKTFLYKCQIEQAGKLDNDIDKLKLDFTENRRFAYVGMKDISRLEHPMKVDENILSICDYFVNIRILECLNDFNVYKKNNESIFSFWQNTTENPYADIDDTKEKMKIQEADLEDFKPDEKFNFNILKNISNLDDSVNNFYNELNKFISDYVENNKEKIKNNHEQFAQNIKNKLPIPKKPIILEESIIEIKEKIN